MVAIESFLHKKYKDKILQGFTVAEKLEIWNIKWDEGSNPIQTIYVTMYGLEYEKNRILWWKISQRKSQNCS